MLISSQGFAVTRTVTNCADDGVGSLRYALASAEASDVIVFDITTAEAGYSTGEAYSGLVTSEAAGNSWFRIILNSYLPAISNNNVWVQGSTQPVAESNNPAGPEVEVRMNGTNDHFTIGDGGPVVTGVTIEGLVLNRCGGINGGNGIALNNAQSCQILGCYIGLSATGEGLSPNKNALGICPYNLSANNKIGNGTAGGRNIISGNTQGVYIEGAGTTNNQVLGNYIGLNSAGTAALANNYGINILLGASQNYIGDGTADGKNVISGNSNTGIYITGTNTNSNEVIGNYIGTTASGEAALPNSSAGVYTASNASYNKIGKAVAGCGNVISGNSYGIILASSTNEVLGNYIGLSASGIKLANTTQGIQVAGISNKIGNGTTLGRNIISGNTNGGIILQGIGSSYYTEIMGNYIGTNVDGTSEIGNGSYGIYSNSDRNKIGDGTDGGRNVISGNSNGEGIWFSIGCSNEVYGNYIGLNAAGTASLANGYNGINISGDNPGGAIGNKIGAAGKGNVISGNVMHGIMIYRDTSKALDNTGQTTILANFIGSNAAQEQGFGNGRSGVSITSSEGNYIGDGVPGDANLIYSHDHGAADDAGVRIFGSPSINNHVLGNNIYYNYRGIQLLCSANNNKIGDGTANGRNYISENTEHGIYIHGSGTNSNEVIGNYIGTDVAGTGNNKNIRYGIYVYNGAAFNKLGPSNIVAFNGDATYPDGVRIDGASTAGQLITQNSIFGNLGKGIALVNGANHGIGSPEVTSFTLYQYAGGGDWLHLTGTATSFAHIELFGPDPNGQGAQYQGSVEADALGNWGGGDAYNTGCATNAAIVVTQTATLTGDTSEFSSPKLITLLTYQPDNMIGALESGTDYFYPQVFESTPATQIKAQAMGTTEAATYYFKVINTGSPEVIIITGEAGGGLFTVKYYDSKTATHEITSDLTGAGFLASLESNASVEGRVELRYSGSVNVTKDLTITAVSTHDAGRVDVVLASTTFYATPYQPDMMVATLESGADYLLEGPPYETIPLVQVRTRSVASNETAIFYFKLKNAGSITEKIHVSAEAGSGNFTVKCFYSKTGTYEITSDIIGAGFLTPIELQPGVSLEGRAEITYSGNTIGTKEIVITSASSHDVSKIDAVKGIATFIPLSPPTVEGHADHFSAVFPSSAIGGVPFAATLNALNAAGSPETNVTVTTYVSVDSGTISPPSIEASGFVSGVWSGNMTLGRPGLRIVTVTQTGCVTMTAEVLTYNATQEYTNPAIPGLKITIPSGAASSDVTVTASIVTDPSSGRTPAGFSIGGSVIEIGPSGTVFLIPVTVIIPISGPLADPRVYYWNGSTWSSDGITIISVTDTLLTFTTTHFTPFAPMGALPDNYVRFAPNPYNPNNGSGRFWYWLDANADTSVYIIDLGGTLVWKRSFSSGINGGQKDGNNIEFDGKTAWGDVLGNGVYIYKIVQDNKSIGGGKIAIIK